MISRIALVAENEIRLMFRAGWLSLAILLLPVFFFQLVSFSTSSLRGVDRSPLRVAFVANDVTSLPDVLNAGVEASCITLVPAANRDVLRGMLLDDVVDFAIGVVPGEDIVVSSRHIGPRQYSALSSCAVSVLLPKIKGEMAPIGSEGAFGPVMRAQRHFGESSQLTSSLFYPIGVVEQISSIKGGLVVEQFAGWLVFGFLLTVFSTVASMTREREVGLRGRLQMFGIGAGVRWSGKLLAYALVHVVQFLLMYSVWIYILPALSGVSGPVLTPHWTALLVTILLTSLMVTMLGICIAELLTPNMHTTTVISGVIVSLSLAAGIMVPRNVMPTMMRDIAGYTPLAFPTEGVFRSLVPSLYPAMPLIEWSFILGWVVVGFGLMAVLAWGKRH